MYSSSLAPLFVCPSVCLLVCLCVVYMYNVHALVKSFQVRRRAGHALTTVCDCMSCRFDRTKTAKNDVLDMNTDNWMHFRAPPSPPPPPPQKKGHRCACITNGNRCLMGRAR